MQAEKTQRASFFDDDDLNITFNFTKPEKAHQKDLAQPHILRDALIKQVSGSSNKQESYYGLHGKTLACYKTPTSKVAETVLDLSFSKLKVIIPEDTQSNFGFSLSKNDITYDFYSTEKSVIEDWVEALKDLCVLKTFHDDYKALKMIGRGSFAKVYLVESKANGKMYAVKAFTKEGIVLSNKNNAKPSMLNEIDIMRALDHENIIKLYEVHETENSIYLVLELIQGKSLQDTLKRPTFKEEYSDVKVLNMIRSILDALDYLASKDIMHRDLKPDNILLDKESKIKIADFGLATLVDLPEYIFKKCGTPGYIAPEVFKYDQKIPATNYDHKCDVFSAGCIFFYMLFGFPFFEASDASEILRLNRKFTNDFDGILVVKQELKNTNSKIPKDALDLLLKLLELDANKRITAGEALCHPYFIPVPKGMSKIAGSNDLISTPVGSPARNSPKAGNFELAMKGMDSPRSPATPLNKDSNRDRFAKKNSFYLDMGKPELNGKIDTLTVGSSNNNSVLLNKRDSNNSVGSGNGCESPSAFARTPQHQSQAQSQYKRSRSLKTYNPMASTGQSFLKAAIFRNMQKNNTEVPTEEGKEESLKIERRRSDNPTGRNASVSSNSRSPDRDSQDEDNSPGLDKARTPGRTPQSSKKRFQPFAQKTSVKNAK